MKARLWWVLAAFLLTYLAGCAPAQVREGEGLYQLHCQVCHGVNALGTAQAPLIHVNSSRQLVERVRQPRGQMPAFPQEQLSDADLKKIAAYVLYLQNEFHAH